MTHGRRILIILLSALLVILGLVTMVMLNSGKQESFYPNFATIFTDDFGTHALYRLIEKQYPGTRRNFYRLDRKGIDPAENLVFIGGDFYYEEAEQDSLFRQIEAGGWAIIASRQGQFPLPDYMGVQDLSLADTWDTYKDKILSGKEPLKNENEDEDEAEEENESEEEEKFSEHEISDMKRRQEKYYAPLQLIPAGIYPGLPDLQQVEYKRRERATTHFNYYAKRINEDFQHCWHSDSSVLHPLLISEEGEIHAAWMQAGKGGVILVSHAYPFTNQGLRNPANVDLVMYFFNFIASRHPGAFVFDEFHNGLRRTKVNSPMVEPEIRYMIWGLFICLGLAVYSGLRRPMRVIPVTKEPRRSVVEFIRSMSTLYQRNQASYFLFLEICVRFVQRLRVVTGITEKDPLKNPSALVRAAEAKWGEAEAQELSALLKDIAGARSKGKGSLALIRKIREFSIRNKLDKHYYVK